MMHRNGPVGAALAVLIPIAAAQTYSSCNPTNSSEFPCTADTGLCQSTAFVSDFTSGDNSSWSAISGTVDYTSDGAEFTIAERGDAPTIQTDFYIFYGKVEVVMKSAPGTGIVSSIVLESDDLDEVDWEFLGGENTLVQSNYFGKGNTTTYDREEEHTVTTPEDTWHTYTVDWTEEKVEWIIDGTTVRTLEYADAVSGTNFPQTPMFVRLGIWAGGDEDNSYWTRVWAGGNTTYSAAAGMPWTMTVANVSITNYNPASKYNYTDTTGDSDSIDKIGTTCSSSGTTATATTTTAATTGSTGTSTSTATSGSSITARSAQSTTVSAYAALGSTYSTTNGTPTTPGSTPTTPASSVYTGAAVETALSRMRDTLVFGGIVAAVLL